MERKFFPNSASLFPIKGTKKNERSPDLTGNMMLGTDLVDYIVREAKAGNQEITLDLSAWKKVTRGGDKFISVSVKEAWKKDDQKPAAPARRSSFDDDDEVPFG